MLKDKMLKIRKGSLLITVLLLLISISAVFFCCTLTHASSFISISCFLRNQEKETLLYSAEQIIQQVFRNYLETPAFSLQPNLQNYLNDKIKRINEMQSNFSLAVDSVLNQLEPVKFYPYGELSSYYWRSWNRKLGFGW